MLSCQACERTGFVFIAAVLLAGCNAGEQLVTRDEVIDIADDAVDASGLDARIAQLEARIAELERRVDE